MAEKVTTIHTEKIIGRPQLVLFGNGFCRLVGGDDWNSLLDNFTDLCPISSKNYPLVSQQVKYEIMTCANEKLAQQHLLQALNDHEQKFSAKIKANCVVQQLFKSLFDIDTDVILTTNFTRELEKAASPELQKTKCRKKCSDSPDKKYYTQTFDQFNTTNVRRLFYIHGDYKRSLSSVILSKDSYDFLLKKIIDHAKDYEKRDEDNKNKLRSWVDAFLVGDIYIVGFGLDFSEQDLWWLLRHKREYGEGKIELYMPASSANNKEDTNRYVAQTHLVSCYGGNVNTLSYQKADSTTVQLTMQGQEKSYLDFYNSAIDDIRKNIAANRKETETDYEYVIELKE